MGSLKCLAQGHYIMEISIKPRPFRSEFLFFSLPLGHQGKLIPEDQWSCKRSPEICFIYQSTYLNIMVFNPIAGADEALGPFSFFRIINIVPNSRAEPQQTPSMEKHAHPPRVVYCAIYLTLTVITKFRVSNLHITTR